MFYIGRFSAHSSYALVGSVHIAKYGAGVAVGRRDGSCIRGFLDSRFQRDKTDTMNEHILWIY